MFSNGQSTNNGSVSNATVIEARDAHSKKKKGKKTTYRLLNFFKKDKNEPSKEKEGEESQKGEGKK